MEIFKILAMTLCSVGLPKLGKGERRLLQSLCYFPRSWKFETFWEMHVGIMNHLADYLAKYVSWEYESQDLGWCFEHLASNGEILGCMGWIGYSFWQGKHLNLGVWFMEVDGCFYRACVAWGGSWRDGKVFGIDIWFSMWYFFKSLRINIRL